MQSAKEIDKSELTLMSLEPALGHPQIAGVPDRHEPDLGEVHFDYLLTLLDTLGYAAG